MAVVNQTVADWKRALQHCDYIIRKRSLSREEATDLTYNGLRSISGIRISGVQYDQLTQTEEVKRRFLRQSFLRVAGDGRLWRRNPRAEVRLTSAFQ